MKRILMLWCAVGGLTHGSGRALADGRPLTGASTQTEVIVQPRPVTVHYEVEERPPARVGQIFLPGNERTRQNVVLRQILPPLSQAERKLRRLNQTIWNHHFEWGTDQLTPGGLDHLAHLTRRRP